MKHHSGSHGHAHVLTLHEVKDLGGESKELDAAMSGSTHVVHVANPIGNSAAGMSEEQFVKKSVDAVAAVTNTAARLGVQRLVVTATMASVCGSQRKTDPNHLWNEADW